MLFRTAVLGLGRAGFTRHCVDFDAASLEVLHLFAAPAKDERVSSLQPQHSRAFLGKLAQQLMNLRLSARVEATILAHIHHGGGGVHQLQNLWGNQPAQPKQSLKLFPDLHHFSRDWICLEAFVCGSSSLSSKCLNVVPALIVLHLAMLS